VKEEDDDAAAVEKEKEKENEKKVDVNEETSSTSQVENAVAKIETTETIPENSNDPNKNNSSEVDKINNLNVSSTTPSQGTISVNLPKEPPKQPDFNPDDPQALEAFILFEMQSFKSKQSLREKY
jgi:hypothetical protein